MRALLVKTDGTTEPVELGGANVDHITQMHEAIGCRTFDCVGIIPAKPGRPGLDMWIDDEGLFLDEPEPNISAWNLVANLTGDLNKGMVVGNVLFTGGADSEGDTLGLTATQASVLTEMAARYKVATDRYRADVEAGVIKFVPPEPTVEFIEL